ncbi:MAG: YCF48-related protein [Ignavibacteria bacterium]|nr:YCF48-related protein [Ignavibacteria bacterium]
MKNLTLIISFFLLTNSMEAQWSNQNMVPEGNTLWSTFFIDDYTGWIVGSDGLILKTTNTGDDWNEQNSGTNESLKSVQLINQSTGWICGSNGLVLLTSDGGNNWIEISSGTNKTLNDLHFIDHNTGFIVGNNETILKSIDGGMNWAMQQTGLSYDLYSVDFVNSNLGYAVGGKDSSNFLKTTDGGISWTKRTLSLNYLATPVLNCVEFIDANTGFVGSEGQYFNHSGNISKTTDGGETWSSTVLNRPLTDEELNEHYQDDNPIDNQRGIRSIWFKDSMNGYAVGGSLDGWWRSLYSTTDGGNSWQKKYGYPEQTGLLSVALTNSGYGIAVGYRGVIYRTTNYGTSWSQLLSGTQVGYTGDWITSVFMINDSVGWAAGYRKGIWYYPIILKTTTGGKIWETNLEFSDSFTRTPASIFFINENIGWVSFYDRGSYKTTDGGTNWFTNGNAGNEKYFINQDTGWATYAPLGIYKSTNGGTSWLQKSSISCNSVFFSDANNGWAVGTGGSILKSTDGGESWFPKTSGVTLDLNSVNFYNNNIGMCVGNSGVALLTTDGGENWILHNIGNTSTLNSVVFTNSATAWISGSSGTILNTTDLGNNWISYNGVTGVNLISTSFSNDNTGWFAGWNGTIIKYQNDILPVELLSFTANVIDNRVLLNWQTATEVNNYGFEIARKTDKANWDNIGFVAGHGTTTSFKSYLFADNTPKSGTKNIYRLKQIDLDGNYEFSSEIEIEILPSKFNLYQNYPNPFNPKTKIKYQLPIESKVVIKIYNILGAEVFELINERKEAGIYEIDFTADVLSSGTYIYTIVADNFTLSKKMILLK